MHDRVRDMALHITGGTPRFLVEAVMRLMEPPDVQEWKEDLEKISLMKNWELQVLYPLKKPPPRCPMIITLLSSDCDIKSIAEGFFMHMHRFKVLDLSENPIENLPSSVSNLKNPTALLLAYRQNIENVPSLSKLVGFKELNGIPGGILSKLTRLQYLNVGETSIRGEEIAGLKKLEFLEKIWVLNCPTLKRMPLNLPKLDHVRTSAGLPLRSYLKPKERWESVEWDHPDVLEHWQQIKDINSKLAAGSILHCRPKFNMMPRFFWSPSSGSGG
ncbi:hypothetical protein Godav_028426 [Gossypium davidsonii]|uniref:NB-ARC domain-containing protein n=1 Tax=Gossypium davidsonii TaxID=34287 RepID=A0A7J8S097_GOSDV|nr:hypothetical protein [Gossypium davidsonii]